MLVFEVLTQGLQWYLFLEEGNGWEDEVEPTWLPFFSSLDCWYGIIVCVVVGWLGAEWNAVEHFEVM
jgi:hypothetical protein